MKPYRSPYADALALHEHLCTDDGVTAVCRSDGKWQGPPTFERARVPQRGGTISSLRARRGGEQRWPLQRAQS